MREEDLTSQPLDATFGEGPQVDLGDITDLIKDSSIVDLSWLSDPITFQPQSDIHNKSADWLEHHWGDTTDNPFGAFQLIKGNPPAREQIQKKKLWDHSEDTKENLYHWAPPSISRVATHRNSISSMQLFKRLMHRGYTGSNLEIESRKYIPQDEWDNTSLVRSELNKEAGLLGNVYVDVTSFESCHRAKSVTDKYNKLAKFVITTSYCGGCSYNSNGRCTLLSKKIATREESLQEGTVKQYLDYLSSIKRIDDSFLSKNASLSSVEKLQKAFLSRKSFEQRVGGVKAKLPQPQTQRDFNLQPFVKVASKYLAKGYDISDLKEKFSVKVPKNLLDSVFKTAIKSMDNVPSSVGDCNSEIIKSANSLQRSAKCLGCSYDMSSHCAVSKVAFNEPKTRENRNISAAFASLPQLSNSDADLVNKTANAFNKGESYARILKAASKIAGTKNAVRILDKALLSVKSASPDQFESCDLPSFRLVSSVKKSAKCNGCSFNRGVTCGLTKRSFVSEVSFDENSTSDHKLYSSFFKDLNFDSLVKVDEAEKKSDLDIQGLNQFNL